MKAAAGLLDEAGRVVAALTRLGLEPILVGGMALVTLGSRRVTCGFDFVILLEARRPKAEPQPPRQPRPIARFL